MKYERVKTTVLMITLIVLMLMPSLVAEAKDKPLPYHFQNANIYYQHGKTHFEWYNSEPGVYGIYEYRFTYNALGQRRLVPFIVWYKRLRVGNVRVQIPRHAFRWKVIHIGQ